VIGNQTFDNTWLFGSVATNTSGYLLKSTALRLPFLLQYTPDDPQLIEGVKKWQRAFVDLLESLRHPTVTISYFTSISFGDEVDRYSRLLCLVTVTV